MKTNVANAAQAGLQEFKLHAGYPTLALGTNVSYAATHKLLNGATKLETPSSSASYCLSVEFQERLR